ncbi:Lrp/AsnC family transcriptional regulator [Mucilaginibacter ginkgonis]|uniref:Lrp/AsnC family transcriptional regulator n=1 Tax=Mucilaginibacter ginkgonis TaxID=2682091 RepID=A0A6I4I5Z2_9SPHI|nr:Lrp/AsnC family transcriptional regulator [Mucilaginibacter ginkgonis]QQL50522.1 Lrp/AsnC family transcriptional regulator [Mucilaginibacter ginkgonis]
MTKLDALDLKILDLLQKDARLTNKEIGLRVHKSITAVYERIKRMEDQGVIKRYVAILDPNQLNRQLNAFTHIQLKDHSKQVLFDFEKTVVAYDEVMECYHMSGSYDFILKISVSDLSAYHDFLINKLFTTAVIGHLESTFVMREAKMDTAFNLDM